MQSEHSIEKTVRMAAGNLHYMLEPFYPALDSDAADIAERNISFQFAHAFLSWHPQGGAFFELPYRTEEESLRRFDFYLHNDDFGIVGETKMLTWQQRKPAKKFDEMLDDKQKMSRSNIENMLKTCATSEAKARKVFRLHLAGAWDEDIVEWWLKGNDDVNDEAFDRSELLDGMFADAVHVIRYPETPSGTSTGTKMETLYLLYAYDIIIPDQNIAATPPVSI